MPEAIALSQAAREKQCYDQGTDNNLHLRSARTQTQRYAGIAPSNS